MLTKKQKELFEFLSDFILKNDISPSFEEMKKFELVQTLMNLSPEFQKLGFVATEAALASGEFGESMEEGTITTIAFNEEQAQMIENNSIKC